MSLITRRDLRIVDRREPAAGDPEDGYRAALKSDYRWNREDEQMEFAVSLWRENTASLPRLSRNARRGRRSQRPASKSENVIAFRAATADGTADEPTTECRR
jgi:hypothetical protein